MKPFYAISLGLLFAGMYGGMLLYCLIADNSAAAITFAAVLLLILAGLS